MPTCGYAGRGAAQSFERGGQWMGAFICCGKGAVGEQSSSDEGHVGSGCLWKVHDRLVRHEGLVLVEVEDDTVRSCALLEPPAQHSQESGRKDKCKEGSHR